MIQGDPELEAWKYPKVTTPWDIQLGASNKHINTEGRQDRVYRWDEMTRSQKLSFMVDKIALRNLGDRKIP